MAFSMMSFSCLYDHSAALPQVFANNRKITVETCVQFCNIWISATSLAVPAQEQTGRTATRGCVHSLWYSPECEALPKVPSKFFSETYTVTCFSYPCFMCTCEMEVVCLLKQNKQKRISRPDLFHLQLHYVIPEPNFIHMWIAAFQWL